MNFRKFSKNVKALSPVVASIILIAVTVAVSIAVAAWMGGLSIGFMQTEQMQITNVQFTNTTLTNQVITINVTNTGTNTITISSVTITPTPTSTLTIAYPTGFGTTGSTIKANTVGSITVTGTESTGLYQSGGSYKVTLLTSKGASFSYTAVAS